MKVWMPSDWPLSDSVKIVSDLQPMALISMSELVSPLYDSPMGFNSYSQYWISEESFF